MATNIFQKLAVVTAGAALSFTVMEANQRNLAEAAILTYDFNVTISDTDGNSRLEGKTGFGQITYDDSSLGSGRVEYSNPSFVSSYFFNFVNFWTGEPKTYTMSNTSELRVAFNNNNLLYIADFPNNYYVYFDPYPRVHGGDLNEEVKFLGTYSVKGEDEEATVPEPSIVAGLSILGFGWLLKRKTR